MAGQPGEWRGTDGPLHVTRGAARIRWSTPSSRPGARRAMPSPTITTARRQEGFGPMETTIWKGRRWSAANAYLRPALKRPGCAVVRGQAARVVIENGRATGVEMVRRGGARSIRAGAEVILSASSINSPKLLMLSGIGPAAHLCDMASQVVADRAGVGANLQDHLELYVQWPQRSPCRSSGTGIPGARHGWARNG